jgi:hypothetical protein
MMKRMTNDEVRKNNEARSRKRNEPGQVFVERFEKQQYGPSLWNCAERMECGSLLPLSNGPRAFESAGKPGALQTLRAIRRFCLVRRGFFQVHTLGFR